MSITDKLNKISQEQRDNTIHLLKEIIEQQPAVIFAYLHGSFLEGYAFHDIDVGIYLSGIEKKQLTNAALEMETRLNKKLGGPVDVRVLNYAPLPFCYHVLKGRLLVDKDTEMRSGFAESVMARYLDMKPVLRYATKEAFSL